MTILNESDFHRIFGRSECAGLEEVMTTARDNLQALTEAAACRRLGAISGAECADECAPAGCHHPEKEITELVRREGL